MNQIPPLNTNQIPGSDKLAMSLWENPDDALCLTHNDGTIAFFNAAFCSLFNRTDPELRGSRLNAVFNGDARKVIDEYAGISMKLKKPVYFEKRVELWDGSVHWLDAKIDPVTYAGDKTLLLFLFRNITIIGELEKQNYELRTLAEKLDQNNKLLKATNKELMAAHRNARERDKSKSAFLANMSHEIRTPMNGILGFAELLRRSDLSAEKQKMYLKIIEQSGHRMLNIINDIIDISKIEAGLVELNTSKINLNNLLRQLYDFFQPEAHKSGIKLDLHLPLPDDSSAFITDPQKLEQILTNLIKNSLKFTEKGSISTGYIIKGPELRLFVRDTGIGIGRENLASIFNRFWKKDVRTSKEYEGSGLGLAISKSFVEMMGGKIQVKSKPGRGSEFCIIFPLEHDSLMTEDSPAAGVPKIVKDRQRRLKVLIAEDDQVSEEYLKAILEPWVSELIVTDTGSEAVRLCRENPDIDIILMDIKMTGMDGLQATREIRKFNRTVPVIAQSAFALEGDRETALEAGCNYYLSKPVKAGQLKDVIKDCLD
jgi:PAS domain S-box-containing protein